MDRIAKLQEWLQTNPDDSFLQHALALEFIKLGEDARARELLIGLLTADPGYIGSYYHLGKLLERTGQPALAVEWYEQGMEMALAAGEQQAYNELKAAYEDLVY